MRKKTTIYLEESLLRAAKIQAARSGVREYEVLEQALKSYLGLGVIEEVGRRAALGEDEALSVAYEELAAARRDRR